MQKVKCPQCKEVSHTITDKFDPDRMANGSMLKLLPTLKELGWTDSHSIHSDYALLICPRCDGQLAPGGKLTLVQEKQDLSCRHCGKELKTYIGKVGHERTCKEKKTIVITKEGALVDNKRKAFGVKCEVE